MAVQKLSLSLALAWFLLAGPFLLLGEATVSPCKRQQVRERKPTFENLHWQEAYLPLAVIMGGCCGLVWWILLVIYNVSQRGWRKGLQQISGQVEPEEWRTTALDHLEEWTDAGTKWDCKGNVCPHVECGPCLPCQPKEPRHTIFWTYLEEELERILLAVRCHRTTEQTPLCEESTNTLAVEKLNRLVGDWQNFLGQTKNPPLTVEGQSSPTGDKQQALPEKGQGVRFVPGSPAKDKEQPQPEEGNSSPARDKQSPPSRQRQSSSDEERKESPNRARGRPKAKSRASSSSRNRGCSSCMNQCCSSRRRGPCSKHK